MGVLLDVGGCRCSSHSNVLEEIGWFEIGSLRKLKVGKQLLQFLHKWCGCLVKSHDATSQRLAAVHLLEDGVHVAGGSEIAQSDETEV